MASFVPTPCIVPLKLQSSALFKTIDNETKIEIQCESKLPNVEVFYTVDGTKPQPFVGIVQGSRTFRYSKPFFLPSGKITVKAIAIHTRIHSLRSSIITKVFNVECEGKDQRKVKLYQKMKPKYVKSEELPQTIEEAIEKKKLDTDPVISSELSVKCHSDGCALQESAENCLDELTLQKSPCSDETNLFTPDEVLGDVSPKETNFYAASEHSSCDYEQAFDYADDSSLDDHVQLELNHSALPNEGITLSDTQFKTYNCIPSDETCVQHCMSCKKVNNISSKYCDSCGGKLYKICNTCCEKNPSVANFCQFCGEKYIVSRMDAQRDKEESKKSCSVSVFAKPTLCDKSSQVFSPVLVSRSMQTCMWKLVKADLSKLSQSTCGRGYWRQQLDYVCNHLKAHAASNFHFQKAVGAPALGKFVSAGCVESNGNVSFQIVFQSLPKCCDKHT